MPDSHHRTTLPPPLALLRDTPAGAIFALAAKDALLEGVAACTQRTVADAEWRNGQRTLVLTLERGPSVTFTAAGQHLACACSCRKWHPQSHCSHVVTGWALLKRAVSPESLAAFRFGDRSCATSRSSWG